MITDFVAWLFGRWETPTECHLSPVVRPLGTHFDQPYFLRAHVRILLERSEYKFYADPPSSFWSAVVETRYGTYYAFTSNPNSAHTVVVYHHHLPRGGYLELAEKAFMTLVARDAPKLYRVLCGGGHPECEVLLDCPVAHRDP